MLRGTAGVAARPPYASPTSLRKHAAATASSPRCRVPPLARMCPSRVLGDIAVHVDEVDKVDGVDGVDR